MDDMKNTLIKIQNFFLTLAMFLRHPVRVPDIILEFRNSQEMKKDIEDMNRERIRSLYMDDNIAEDDIEAKKKE